MRLIDADALRAAMYHEAFENDASYDEKNPLAKWDSGLWVRYKMFERCLEAAPSIDAVPTDSISRIEKELHGRDVEMQYEIIRWLWNYGNQFTDSRTAIIQWLRGEES